MKESPLFWPLTLKNQTIYCLDETALPDKLVYLKAKNLKQALALIKTMKTRAFGQVLMAYLIFLLLLKKNTPAPAEKIMPILQKAADKINAARPTFPFAFFTKMVLGWAKEGVKTGEPLAGYVASKISHFLAFLREKRLAQARTLSALLKDGDIVLTHCNVSGLLVSAAQVCREQNKKIKFIVTETRPYLQGARLTAWELQRAGFDVTIIPDSAVAFALSRKAATVVVVGADQMAQNGDIANKIGTYQIALLAREFKIPFYVLTPPPSAAKTGNDIKIEIRPERELLEIYGRRIAPRGAKALYPAFDITPRELISRYIALELR
ncbi:MAG: S-methyl-5-thioribose-1-phosphate isomerase [Candidatus Omnitrophota bacterium]